MPKPKAKAKPKAKKKVAAAKKKKVAAKKKVTTAKKKVATAKKKKVAAKKPTAKPDKVVAAKPRTAAKPKPRREPAIDRDRSRFLRDGEIFGAATVSHHPIAELSLPTGKIVTCDPFLVEGPTLDRTVRPGRYPVILAITTVPGSKSELRVAAAIVRFGDGMPARWEPAAEFRVDSQAASFMEVGAYEAIRAEPNYWPTRSFKSFDQQLMTDHYAHVWGWAVYQPDAASPGNCVAFMAGWGDGTYASYWGLDAAGAPLCLVTDLDVFTDDEWA